MDCPSCYTVNVNFTLPDPFTMFFECYVLNVKYAQETKNNNIKRNARAHNQQRHHRNSRWFFPGFTEIWESRLVWTSHGQSVSGPNRREHNIERRRWLFLQPPEMEGLIRESLAGSHEWRYRLGRQSCGGGSQVSRKEGAKAATRLRLASIELYFEHLLRRRGTRLKWNGPRPPPPRPRTIIIFGVVD